MLTAPLPLWASLSFAGFDTALLVFVGLLALAQQRFLRRTERARTSMDEALAGLAAASERMQATALTEMASQLRTDAAEGKRVAGLMQQPAPETSLEARLRAEIYDELAERLEHRNAWLETMWARARTEAATGLARTSRRAA